MTCQNTNKKVVIVVDAYSTGKYLPGEIIKRGFDWIHVISRTNLPSLITTDVNHQSCLSTIYFQHDLPSLLQKIDQYKIVAVMAGTETSVELTDLIAHSLHLPGNDPTTSYLRRNKYHMVAAVANSGLLTAKQHSTDSIESLLAWYHTNFSMGDTIVIKPSNSAGTDHVTFCSSDYQIEAAAKEILGKENRLGLINEFVLAQSFLDGQEYVVNTVSMNGKHHLTDIWRCHKQRIAGAGFVPGCEVLLPSTGAIQHELRSYAFKALDALGFVQGPAHFEIMYTSKGPAIIEVGARIQGGVNPKVHLECIGTSQLVKAVDTYLNPEHFLSYYQQGYSLSKHSRWADLIAPSSGIIKSFTLVNKVTKLRSFYSANVTIKPGDYLERTIDLYTSPGSIYLVNENPDLLENDYLILRELEKHSYEFISAS